MLNLKRNIFLPIIIFIISFCCISIDVHAQNLRKQRADKFYESGEYTRAAVLYRRALKKIKNKAEKAETNFLIADCFRRINSFKKIESFYKRAISLRYTDPILYLHFGQVLLIMEKFDDARLQFETYKKLVPSDKRGDEGLETIKLANDWKNNPNYYNVTHFKKINSKYDDFCPSYDETKDFNDIYFSTNRDKNPNKKKRKRNTIGGPKKSNITGELFCDIFFIKKNRKGEWEKPEPLDTTINTVFDDGATTISKDGKIMYFSHCKMEKGKQIGCHIYELKKTGGNWGIPQYVKLLKDSALSIGHPTISEDGNTLYFASYMKGGKGGLDIFKAEKNEEEKYIIENIKFPINSSGDDFGIVFQGKSEKGLFTSNRKGGMGGDDIYLFELPPVEFHVKGLVKNESENILPGAIVRLFGSDGSQFRDTTDKEGFFKRKLKKNTDYVFA